jgi:hypothetical protein
MRLLLGMVLGAALTIGLAYMHDSAATPSASSPGPSEVRPMVNWDVVSNVTHRLSSAARAQWERLTAR